MPVFSSGQTSPGKQELDVPGLGGLNPPQVAHVFIELSHLLQNDSYQVKALHDSGCAKSLIHENIFKQIPFSDQITVTKLPHIFISSCTGEQTNVKGMASINMTFIGENNNKITFPHDVLIHDSLEHDFLLGRDFTGSPVKILETNSHIYLSKNPQMNSIENIWSSNKSDYVDVPIIGHTINSHSILTNNEAWIPPFSLVAIPCSLSDTNDLNFLTRSKEQTPTFEVCELFQPSLKKLDALLTFSNPHQLIIPIYNPTSNDIFIAKDEKLASIKFWDETSPIYSISVFHDEPKIFQSNNSNIVDDEIMTSEEKTEAFQEFLESGKYTPPMTSYIEKTPSITEMSYKNVTPLTDAELEKQFDLKHLSHSVRKQALRIFNKNKEVFSRHEMDLGRSKNVEMEILVDATKPRIQKYYPLPHAARGPVRKILDQMEEFGIIRECQEASLFVSNLLATRKKNMDYRVLLDGRLLNNATIKQATTLVAPIEVFAALSKKTYVSTFDVSNAFFQVPIKWEHQPLTAFYSEAHGKRYCYTRAAQGLKNSPLYLKLLMDTMLGHLAKYVIHYADDVMIATDGSIGHHLDIVNQVLKQFKKENIKIRPAKMAIAKPEIEFLGIIWKKNTLNIPEARVQGFFNMAKPKTPRQVKSFVAAMSWYRRFIPYFADLAKPLSSLLDKHHKQFKWLPEHDKAYNAMLMAIKENTQLNLPDPNKTFYVQTDASDVAGAGRVFQKDEDGNEKLLACVSRTFTKAERKYGVFRKEVLSLLYCLKSMDFFLRFAPKVVFLIDAKAIIFLRLCKESAGILLRFSIELSKYDAEIFHVPGEQNQISDLMSRAHKDISTIIAENKQKNVLTEKQSLQILDRLTIPSGKKFTPDEVACLLEMDSLPGPPSKKKKPESKSKLGTRIIKNTPKTIGERKVKLPPTSRFRPGVILPKKDYNNNDCYSSCYSASLGLACKHTKISYSDFGNMSRIILPGNISLQDFSEIQKKDERYGKFFDQTNLKKGFKIVGNLLFKFHKSRHRLVLPSALMDAVITSKHFSIMGLHFSKARIRRDVLARYHCHIRTFNKKLSNILSSCIQCQMNSSTPVPHIFKQSDFVFGPRISWAVDIIPSLTTTKKGNTAIFLAVDMFTGFIQLKPIKSRQTDDMIEAVKSTILAPFGIPKYFRCDNESGMANSVKFKQFMDPFKINFLPTSTASPWSNGMAERAVQSIKKTIRHFIIQEKCPQDWDEFIYFFANAHNKSTNVHNFSPEELQFGLSNPSITDLIEFWPNFSSQNEYMEKIIPYAEELRKRAREKSSNKSKQTITFRNQKRKLKSFSPGQIVIHRQLQVSTGQGGALKPLYTGPYVINSIDKDNSSATIEHLQTGHDMQAHFSNIQLLQYDPSTSRLPDNFDALVDEFLPEKFSAEVYFPEWNRHNRTHTQSQKEDRVDIDSSSSSSTSSSSSQSLSLTCPHPPTLSPHLATK